MNSSQEQNSGIADRRREPRGKIAEHRAAQRIRKRPKNTVSTMSLKLCSLTQDILGFQTPLSPRSFDVRGQSPEWMTFPRGSRDSGEPLSRYFVRISRLVKAEQLLTSGAGFAVRVTVAAIDLDAQDRSLH